MSTDVYSQIVDYIISNQTKFYRLAYSYVHNKEGALDIVQNSVVKALENYSSIRDTKYIKTWFYRVLVNESLSCIRKNKRELLYAPEDMVEEAYEEPGFNKGYELDRYIRSLPETTRIVIVLYYYEEFTLKEISEITKDNLNTVKYRLYAGLKKLKKMMEEVSA
jgi:RNA polymerase sigma-70 factor (ECF subfamily)